MAIAKSLKVYDHDGVKRSNAVLTPVLVNSIVATVSINFIFNFSS
jgi:hypothetical protein